MCVENFKNQCVLLLHEILGDLDLPSTLSFLCYIYFHRTHCSVNPVLRFTIGFITTLYHRFIADWCSQCSSKWYEEGKVTIWLHCLTIVWLSHFLYLISPLMRLHCLHIAFTWNWLLFYITRGTLYILLTNALASSRIWFMDFFWITYYLILVGSWA